MTGHRLDNPLVHAEAALGVTFPEHVRMIGGRVHHTWNHRAVHASCSLHGVDEVFRPQEKLERRASGLAHSGSGRRLVLLALRSRSTRAWSGIPITRWRTDQSPDYHSGCEKPMVSPV